MDKINKDALLRRIQAHSFAKTECELFLDSHPDDKMALDYYHKNLDALLALTAEYEANFGPLTAAGAARDRWSWIEGPWPWQREGDLPIQPRSALNCRGERE
ncbi:MAG: spore coat protein CotJB [Clostridia bacterium]|nr:spore coat protein CotJB [Clostridia bacterium]